MSIAERPFDKVNVKRKLYGLPTKAKSVNHSFYNINDNQGVPNDGDYLERYKNTMRKFKKNDESAFWKDWKL